MAPTDAAIGRGDPVLSGIVRRLAAPGGYEAFASQVRAVGGCRRPVRLQGRISEPMAAGVSEVLFDSRELPDGVLLKACGTRREALCPPCASVYRSDAFHLVASGLRGGKGVGIEVAERPVVFLTLTAPSFGAVHRRLPDGSCHLVGQRCEHGQALVCPVQHDESDPSLGEALCASCYDFEGAVLFNAGVAELWRRTMIYGLRSLGGLLGTSVRTTASCWRLSYVKVVEFQRRGSVHVHALVRLDRRPESGSQVPHVDAAMLADAITTAARKVSAPCLGRSGRRMRWGVQLEAVVVGEAEEARRRAAAYCAKYATKGVVAGGALDRGLKAGVPAELELPRHLRRLVEQAWKLGGDPALAGIGLRRWAHMCGFRGHVLTKSQAYSTTFGALRSARQAWILAGAGHLDDEREAEWTFVGVGYTTAGDACLAAGIEEERRLGRLVAHEEWYWRGDVR